jgi:DNA-binding transcriptional LysR family regulator
VAEVDRVNGLASGALSVGAGFIPYDLLVAPAIGRLARMHPGLHLRVAQVDWRTVATQVLSGTLDLGVAGLARADVDPALVVEPLTVRPGTFFVRRGHPLSRAAKLSLKQLAPYAFVMGPIPRLAPFFQRAGIKGRIDFSTGDFIPAITVESVALMKSIVSDTDAFGAAPEAVLSSELAAGQLVKLPIDAPWAVAVPGIVRLRDRPMTPAQETFLALLRAVDREVSALDTRNGAVPVRARLRSSRSVVRKTAATAKR